jgi:hypothetical protein
MMEVERISYASIERLRNPATAVDIDKGSML